MAYRTGKALKRDPFEDVADQDYITGDPVDYDPFEDEEEEKPGFLARARSFLNPSGEPGGAGADYYERKRIRDAEAEQKAKEAQEAQEPVKPAAPLAGDLRAEREGVAPERKPLGIPGPGEASEFMAAPGQLGEPMLKEDLPERPITPFEQAYQKEMAELEGRPVDELEEQIAADKAADATGEVPAEPDVDPETGRPIILEGEPWRWEDAKKDAKAWTKGRQEKEKRHQKTINDAKKAILEKDPTYQFAEGQGPWVEDPRELHERRGGYGQWDPDWERDLTGEKGEGFVGEFGSRMQPGFYTGVKRYEQGLYTMNYYLWLDANTKQRQGLDSVADQLAKGAHPDDVQKQEAYKVRLQQEASDLWGSGHLADDLIFAEAEKHGVMLKERPNDILTWAQPPEDMDDLRKKSAKRIEQVDKDIKQYYKDNPHYKLPDDWEKLTATEQEVKYPGIFWGEQISTNAINSILSIGTYLGVQTATKNATLATLVAGMVLYPQFVKEISDELKNLEQTEGIVVPDEIKAELSLIMAMPSSMIEGLGERLGFGPRLLKHFGKKVGAKVMRRQLIKKFVQSAMAKRAVALARPTLWTAKQAGAGYVEEAGQQIVSNAAAQYVGSERSLFQGVHEAGRIGAVLEPVLGGPAAATTFGYGKVKEARLKKKVEKAGKEQREQVDRLIKDYEGQTAEDLLLDEDLAPEAETEFTGAEGIEAEETAAEFTEEELEAAAAAAPAAPAEKEAPSVSKEREQIPGEKPLRKEPIKAPIEEAGEKAAPPGGVFQAFEKPTADVRITPEPKSKRKVFQGLANDLGTKAGAKIRFDNVVYQNEKPVALQMTVTSGAAKGATFTISDRAHKTKAEAQRFVDSIIKGFTQAVKTEAAEKPFKDIAGIIEAAQKPDALKKEYDDLVASLTPEQEKSVRDLIKDPKMKIKEKLGLMRADLATLATKQELKKKAPPKKVEVKPAPPAKVEPGEKLEPTAEIPAPPPGDRWTADRGAIPGEPLYFLDQSPEGPDDSQAAIIEHEVEDGSLFELVAPDGRTLGMFKNPGEAAKAAEDMFEPPAPPTPTEKPAAPPPPAPTTEGWKTRKGTAALFKDIPKERGEAATGPFETGYTIIDDRDGTFRIRRTMKYDDEKAATSTEIQRHKDTDQELWVRAGSQFEGAPIKFPSEKEAQAYIDQDKKDLGVGKKPAPTGGPRVPPTRTTPPVTPPTPAPEAPAWQEFVKPGGVEEDYVKIALGELDPRSYAVVDKARQWIVDTRDSAQAYTDELEKKGIQEQPGLKYDFFKRKLAFMEDLLDKIMPVMEKYLPAAVSEKQRTRIITPKNPEGHRATYLLVEADKILPSHNPETFQKNAEYPDNVQERAYHTDTAEQAKVVEHAQKLDPRILLSDDPTPTNGPPIVEQNNIVLSGNSRAMSILRAFKDSKKAAKYKNQLAAQASKFGLAPKDVKAMKQPVLVRRMYAETDDMMRALAREFNETMTAGMGEAAEIASMGKSIKNETIEKIGNLLAEREGSLRELLGKKDGIKILGWLVDDGAISATQKNRFLNKEGDLLNKTGKETIESAIFGNIIDDLDLINSAQKSHLNKIEKSLAQLAKIKARGEAWDITGDLKEALRLATAAQARDQSVREYLMQQPLFDVRTDYTIVTEKLADLIIKDKPTRFKERWAGYATDAVADSKKQVQMFKPKTQRASLKEHFDIDAAEAPAAPVEAPAEAPPAISDGELLAGRIRRGEIDLTHAALKDFEKSVLVKAAQELGIKATGNKGPLILRITQEAPKIIEAEAAPAYKGDQQISIANDVIPDWSSEAGRERWEKWAREAGKEDSKIDEQIFKLMDYVEQGYGNADNPIIVEFENAYALGSIREVLNYRYKGLSGTEKGAKTQWGDTVQLMDMAAIEVPDKPAEPGTRNLVYWLKDTAPAAQKALTRNELKGILKQAKLPIGPFRSIGQMQVGRMKEWSTREDYGPSIRKLMDVTGLDIAGLVKAFKKGDVPLIERLGAEGKLAPASYVGGVTKYQGDRAPKAPAEAEEKPMAELPFLDDEIGTVRSVNNTESKLIAKGENIGILTQLWRPTGAEGPGAQSTVRVVDKDAGEVVSITTNPSYPKARLAFVQARNADIIAEPPARPDDARTEATGILAGKIKQAEDKGFEFYFPEDAPRAMTEDDFMELVGAVSGGYAERLILEKDVIPLLPSVKVLGPAEAPAPGLKETFDIFEIEKNVADELSDQEKAEKSEYTKSSFRDFDDLAEMYDNNAEHYRKLQGQLAEYERTSADEITVYIGHHKSKPAFQKPFSNAVLDKQDARDYVDSLMPEAEKGDWKISQLAISPRDIIGIGSADEQEFIIKVPRAETAAVPAPAEKAAPEHEKAAGSASVARWVKDKLETSTPITWRELFKAGDKLFGGTQAHGVYTPKDAYDAMELGVNLYLQEQALDRSPVENIIALKNKLDQLPTQTKRTREQGEFQQFSTPPPLAYVANWVANITETDSYLEPSAGVGGLAVFGQMSEPAGIVTNELDKRRAALLGELGFKTVFTEDASQLDNILPDDVKPTVIVMNPPFSATAGRIKGARATKFGAQQIEQALNRLADGGRLVAIVGKGMGSQEPGFKSWWKIINSKYTVKANVRVSGQEYRKYGTTFDNQLIIIDKIGKTDYNLVKGKVDKIEDLIPLLEGVRNDRQAIYKPGEELEPVAGVAPGEQVPDTEQEAVGAGELGGTAIPGVGPGVQPIEPGGAPGIEVGGAVQPPAEPGGELPEIEGATERPGEPERPGERPGERIRPGDERESEGIPEAPELSLEDLDALIDEVIEEEDLTAKPAGGKKAAPKKPPVKGKIPKTEQGQFAAIANIIGNIKEPTAEYKPTIKADELDLMTQTWAEEIGKDGTQKAQDTRGILKQLIEPLSQIADSDPIEMNVPGLDQDIFFANQKDARDFLEAYDGVLDDYLAYGNLINQAGAAPRSIQTLDNITTKIFPKTQLASAAEVREPAAAFEALLHPQAYEQAKPILDANYTDFEGAKKEWIRYVLVNLAKYNIDPEVGRNWIKYYYTNDRPDLAPKARPPKKDLIQARKKRREKIKASLYEEYQANIEVKGARPHPTPLVETAALSDTDLPPATYKPDLPQNILKPTKKSAGISDVQLEANIYAGQAHERFLPDGSRQGAFAGHGTGVGKGRIIASIIMDNWRKGRKKAIWLTEKQSLLNDATRDIIEMGWSEGAKALVNLNKAAGSGQKVKAKHRDNTILFSTYATMAQGFKKIKPNEPESFNDMRARINQIVEWAGADYDGVIAFDESHNMANSMQEQGARGRKPVANKALAGVLLQTMLPKARVLYISATGATKVSNFAYAERLGLWGEGTAFPSKQAFIGEINKSGLAAMEMIARGMKARGLYMAPSLSYDGVLYNRLVHELTGEQTEIYDKIAESWQIIMRNVERALNLTNGNLSARAKMSARGRLFGTQIRVFDSIMTAMQMPSLITKMEKHIADGESVVIQLTQTNDAPVQRALERRQEDEDLEDLDFTPRMAISEFLQRAFPVEQYEIRTDDNGNNYAVLVRDDEGNPVLNREAVAMRDAMLRELGALRIPESPLDQLFNVFGVDKVAEVSGRKSRVVRDPETGEYINQKWSPAKSKADVEAFKNDEKQILIFSEAGGTGSSYHADKRFKNQRLRQHYLLQPGWKASTAVQGLGRTHRSNQAQAPIYTLITTNLKAQKRFVTSIARRLDQLGALTKGQRQAGSQGIFQARDNLESDYAREALVQTFEDMVADRLEISVEEFEHQTGLQIVDERTGRLRGDLPEMTKVLNRMLSMSINSQNIFFGDISDRLDRIIQAHAEAGTLDVGIETIDGLAVEKKSEKVVHTEPESGAETKYVRVSVTEPSRRVAFEDVSHLNFYQNIKSGRIWAAGEPRDRTTRAGSIIPYRKMQSPNDTIQRQDDEILNDADKWIKLRDKPELQPSRIWAEEYANIPETTDREIHLITGDLLSVWDRLVGFATVYRMETDAGERLLGRVIHPNVLDQVLTNLGASADAPQVKSGDLGAKILGGARVTLANGWSFKKSMVSGDERIELLDFGHRDIDLLEKQGAFIEEINFKTRVFIPTKNNKKIFDRILLNRPVTQIAGGYQGPRIADTTLSEASTEFAGKIVKKIQAGKKATQLDLLDFAKTASAEAEKAVEALPEPTQKVVVKSTGEMGFESHVIANADDAAAFIQPITEQAQEKGYMISVDAQGNIKEVHFIAKGARGAVGIPIVETVGRLFNTPGVTKAYFIHNHPSAETDPSPEDRGMAYTLIEMAAAGGVEIENIIVGGDEWALYNPISAAPSVKKRAQIRKTTRKTTIPIVERFIKRGKRRGAAISDSGKLKAHLEKYYNDAEGYLFLDNKLNDLGFMEFVPGQTAAENLKQIIAEGERLNATVFIFNDRSKTEAEFLSRMEFLKEWNENVGGNLMQLFEVRHNGVSLADQGLVPQPKTTEDILEGKVPPITFDYILSDKPVFARKTIRPADPMSVEEVRLMVDAATATWAPGGPVVKVYQTQAGLQNKLHGQLKKENRENDIVAGAYYDGTIYLVAENIESNEEVITTLLHEGFGHHGLRGTLGKAVFPVLRDLYIAKRKDVDVIGTAQGFDMKTVDGQMQAAEEWFANQAQQGIKSKWYDRLVRAIRNWIRNLGINVRLSDPEIRALIAAARQFTLTGQKITAHPGQMIAFKKKKYGETIEHGHILSGEVKRRMEKSKGVAGKGTILQRTKEKAGEIWEERAHFPGLEKIEDKKLRAQLADILRIHQEVPEHARSLAAEVMRGFISDLSTDAYNIYTTNIILGDMVRDTKGPQPLLTDAMLGPGETFPFGFESVEEIIDGAAKYKALAEQHPEIKKALAQRKAFIDSLVGQMVKYKILKKEVMQHEDYYHHQVLKYWGAKDDKKGLATGSADVRQHWRPWMAARKGSLLDYNTEYVEAEFTALSQQIGQLETAKTLERLKRKSDIYTQLKGEAKRQNLTNFYKQEAERLSDLFKTPITVGEVMADKELDPLFQYRQKIAMASSQLENLAFKGEIGGDSEFSDIIDQLAEIKRAKKEDLEGAPSGISDARYFDFLAYLVRTGQPGASWAATIFKAIHAREKHIKDGLGKNFLTYKHMMPSDYAEWKPEPGKGMFWANTMADNVIRGVIAGERELQDTDVKQILAKGRDIIWVLPKGLIQTLDNFKRPPEVSKVGQLSEATLRMWKQYILLNPVRVLKYNLNNMSGDLDIVLAYNPRILKEFRGALRDLRAFSKGKASAAVRTELELSRKIGVTGSGWSVQEVEDITKQMGTDKFVRQVIMGEKPNLAMKYWQMAKGATTMRENILRLAAFRHFKKEVAAGKRVYGASKPIEIDAIEDQTEKAAKLARELVGDYGNISHSGQYIRKRMMPFYSWMEINSPRYVYMLRNVKYEGREVGARPLKIIGIKGLTKATLFGIKAMSLFALVNIYNNLFYPEEEEEYGKSGRRQLHLMLPRAADGTLRSIRFQGALSDTLSFFGLEDWPQDIKDLYESKQMGELGDTVQQKLIDIPIAFGTRFFHAIRPEVKIIGEGVSGYAFYPDPLNPRPIRDTVEHILRTFSLDSVYRRAVGKPGRGKTMAQHFLSDLTRLLVYKSDPGEQAYYETRNMIFDYKKKTGDEVPSGKPTNKGNALYYYRQALKYGDMKAAERYLMKYYDLKGTPTGLKTSIKRAHPLSGIKKAKRFRFKESLNPAQRATLDRAMKWYDDTYRKGEHRKLRSVTRRKWLKQKAAGER